jgi:hypothetical protein
MLTLIGQENLLEIRATDRQHNFVGMQNTSGHGQSHITQVASIEQILETRCDIVPKIVPAQRELVHISLLFFKRNLRSTTKSTIFWSQISRRRKKSEIENLEFFTVLGFCGYFALRIGCDLIGR